MLPARSDRYRPDIEGLRAVAVLLVVLFHAFPEAMPGGFIGVDIFFVISGFLITGIIARELDAGRFDLRHFYDRRIGQSFPALIVVLGAVLVLGWFWMLPGAYARLSADVFASAAFAANIALLLNSGYFDIRSAEKPLLHLWSLGIEEQFYLFWPLILMLAARLRLSLLAVALAIALRHFVLNVALIGTNPVATFYLPLHPGLQTAHRRRARLRLEPVQPWRHCQQPSRRHRHRADCGSLRRSRQPQRLSGLVGAFARHRGCAVVVGAGGVGGAAASVRRARLWCGPARSATRSISGTGRYWCFSRSSSSHR